MKLNMSRVAAFAAASALALSGCSTDAERDEDGEVLESKEISVADLRDGDCYLDPADETLIETLTVTPCTEAHDSQVYHVYEFEGDDFPGDAALTQDATEKCEAAFEPEIGISYAESALSAIFFTPVEESWDLDGGKEIACIAYMSDLSQLTVDIEGSGL